MICRISLIYLGADFAVPSVFWFSCFGGCKWFGLNFTLNSLTRFAFFFFNSSLVRDLFF